MQCFQRAKATEIFREVFQAVTTTLLEFYGDFKHKRSENNALIPCWEFLGIPNKNNRTEQCSVFTQRKQKKNRFAETGVSAT